MSFRLVPKSVTLNDLERRNGVILRCFSEFGYLPGALRKSSRSLSHLLMSCYCGQTAGCVKMPHGMEVGLSPADFVLHGDPASSAKRGGAPNFRPTSIVAKRLHQSKCHLVRR